MTPDRPPLRLDRSPSVGDEAHVRSTARSAASSAFSASPGHPPATPPTSIEETIRRVVREEVERAIPSVTEAVAARFEPSAKSAPRPTASLDRLTLDVAAQYARRGRGTIGEALRRGELHGTQRSAGSRWTILRSCVNAYLEGSRREHRPREPLDLRRR